jgi:hypothetical protein
MNKIVGDTDSIDNENAFSLVFRESDYHWNYEHLSHIEQAAILRVKYDTPPTEDIIRFEMFQHGGEKIEQLEKTLLDEAQGKYLMIGMKAPASVILDALEAENYPITLRKHHRAIQTFNGMLLQAIGLEFNNGMECVENDFTFTSESSTIKELIEKISAERVVFNGLVGINMDIKLTKHTKYNPIPFIIKWCEELGIKLIYEQNAYFVDVEWLKIILVPIQKNLKNGVNPFLIEIEKERCLLNKNTKKD